MRQYFLAAALLAFLIALLAAASQAGKGIVPIKRLPPPPDYVGSQSAGSPTPAQSGQPAQSNAQDNAKSADGSDDSDNNDKAGDNADEAQADDGPQPWRLFPPERTTPLDIGGWVQGGYHEHALPLSRESGDGLSFNDSPHRFNLHQGWLHLEKAIDAEKDGDWGFRTDLIYGIDGPEAQGFGGDGWDSSFDHGRYGWAIPQAFVVAAWDNVEVKLGHFFTLLGYEAVGAHDNFFYSHSLTNYNSEPFTHTGGYATFTLTEQVKVVAGWTNGWDTGFRFSTGANSGIFGAQWTPAEDVTIAWFATAGNFGARGHDGYSHSFVAQLPVTKKLKYVFQTDLLSVDADTPGNALHDDDLGINQYLLYEISECVKVGGRCEWWKDDGVSYQELTGGFNLMPNPNLTVRPEIRHDWSHGADLKRTTFGIDAIYTY